MFIDKDSRGRYVLAGLTATELETIRRALKSHRCGLLNGMPDDAKKISEREIQYYRAGKILQIIERK